MKAWKNSPGHYDTIKMKNLKYGAISAYVDGDANYWVSLMTEPKLDDIANSIEN